MPMPKGHKLENGYSTSKSLGGDSYQEISDKMSDQGFKMNHSTARNVFVNSLKKIAKDVTIFRNLINGVKKIAKDVTSLYDIDCDDRELSRIAKDPRFQGAIVEFMRESKSERG